MSGHVDNEILIKAPLELVWERTNDVESWTELFSEYSAVEILSERDGTIVFRLALHPDENGKVWDWVSARTPDHETYTVRSQRVQTGPFKYMWIYWEYSETPDGTRMRWVQDFEMKPTAPIDDEGMRKRLDHNTGIQQKLIRDRLEQLAGHRAAAR